MAGLPRITEHEFLRQVLEYARLHGWLCAHFRPARTAQGWRTAVQGDGKGFPDLVLVRDRLVAAELKRSRRERPRPEQVAWIGALRAAGVEAHCWAPEDWAEIERVLGRDGS